MTHRRNYVDTSLRPSPWARSLPRRRAAPSQAFDAVTGPVYARVQMQPVSELFVKKPPSL